MYLGSAEADVPLRKSIFVKARSSGKCFTSSAIVSLETYDAEVPGGKPTLVRDVYSEHVESNETAENMFQLWA